MGTVTLSKQNHLFWLGRYSSRAFTMLQYMLEKYDQNIDGESINYEGFCHAMGIPCPYENSGDFCRRYLFDWEDPCSVAASVEDMLGNGMVLRETLTTPTLAYLQMARTAMKLAAQSTSPAVELQWVLDDIMAFRGSYDDTVEEERARNIIKCGWYVERVSLLLRLNWHMEMLDRELSKLFYRQEKTDLPVDPAALDALSGHLKGGGQLGRLTLLRSVEGLFHVV